MRIDVPDLSHDGETCPLIGAPCPAACRLAVRLAAAVRAARVAAGPQFRFEGRAEVGGCRTGCSARITTTADVLRVACGSGATVERPLPAAGGLH